MRKPRKAALAASMLSSCLLLGAAFAASPAAADPAEAGRSFNTEITACIAASAGTDSGARLGACVEAARKNLLGALTAPAVAVAEPVASAPAPVIAGDTAAAPVSVPEVLFAGTAEGSLAEALGQAPAVDAELAAEVEAEPEEPPAPSGGYAGGVWASLRWCESTNDYTINTGNGYYGAYQFSLATWRGLGYAGYPHLAAPAVQDQAAKDLQARDGWWPWPSCARQIGLL